MIISVCQLSWIRWHQNPRENDALLRPLKNFARKSPHSRLFMTEVQIQFSLALIALNLFVKSLAYVSEHYSNCMSEFKDYTYARLYFIYRKELMFHNLYVILTLLLDMERRRISKNTEIRLNKTRKGRAIVYHQLWVAVPLAAIDIAIWQCTRARRSLMAFENPSRLFKDHRHVHFKAV